MTKLSKENIFYSSLYAFLFLIPIAQDLSVKFLIIAILFSLAFIRNPAWKTEFFRNCWDLLIYFLVLTAGLLHTDDLFDGLSVLEKNLSFVMVPLLFSRIRLLDKESMNRIFVVFTIGVITSSCICLGYAIWRDVYLGFSGGYYYDEFTSIIDSHPTYMAYYVCFSIIFLLYVISYETVMPGRQAIIVAGILFLSFVLMLTAGRSTFVSMLMMASFFFLKLLFEQQPLRKRVQGMAVTFALLIILLIQSPYAQRMYPNFLSGRTASPVQLKGDTWERLVLWESSIKASSNLLIGVGTGDNTRVITDYYRSHHLTDFADASFNAHNQFIQILFSNGLVGLLALLLIMLRPIVISARRQNIFGMLALFPFLIYGISEVFLGRYQGIIFFVLLHQIFIKYLNQNLSKFSIRDL